MSKSPAISTLEYHVLLSLATAPKHGYAIKESVETESAGTLTPPAGSLYRVIARLVTRGWVVETDPDEVVSHPGLARRYYALTSAGRAALANEAQRLKDVGILAARRLSATKGPA
jgi:DNA-binding PadR family transcriptional regulator